jgi:small subunit ribosomal protein S19
MDIGVLNGKGYISCEGYRDMLGHRLGEFTLTRKAVKHGAAGIGATRSSASMSVRVILWQKKLKNQKRKNKGRSLNS